VKTIGLGCFLWLFMGAIALGSVPARLEYQGYLTDSVGTPIHCQGCAAVYIFKFSIYDEQADGTLLWSEVHSQTDIVQGVFRVELGLESTLDAELLEGDRWLEIQINEQAPMAPRQRIISVPYALRASVAEHAIESENAASLGGQPVENFVQVVDTTDYLNQSDLGDVLAGLGYSPGDNDSLADINTCAADEILRWNGSAWICGVDQNSDGLSSLLCAGGEIAQWDGSAWGCSAALNTLQVNIDQVQANVAALDASLDPIAKDGLPADLADGDQVGITIESDPSVGATTADKWCRGTGTTVTCDQEGPNAGGSLGPCILIDAPTPFSGWAECPDSNPMMKGVRIHYIIANNGWMLHQQESVKCCALE